MGLFKKKKQEDEWVTQTRNKIYAEVYILVIAICGISIVVKFFINAYAANLQLRNDIEIIILLASAFYYLHRSVRLGIFSAEAELNDRKSKWSRQTKNIFLSIAAGFGIAVFMGLNSAVNYGEGTEQSIYYFFMVMIVTLIIYVPVMLIIFVVGNGMAKRESDRVMDDMLKDDSNGEDDEKY